MAIAATGIHAAQRLDELYRAHATEIYRYAYAVLGNRADAEDVMQTTFVNALQALERGERPRKPANWLVTIAHNLIRQRFRQQSLRPRQVELDTELPSLEDDDSGPSLDDLVRALQRIPETQREALVLRELDGRSCNEVAAILGVSSSAVEGLLFRARRSLADELANLVTCDRAELALSQAADGRLGRKERRRLLAHLEECSSCARIAALAVKRRRAFKALALLPLPWSLTFFKSAPSASAAVGLPSIGGAAAAGGTAGAVGGGVAAKVAIGLAAVAVAGGAGYEGVKQAREAATPVRPARAAPASAVAPVAPPRPTITSARPRAVARAKPTPAKPRPERVRRPVQANVPVRGRSAAAPGHTKAAKLRIAAPQATRPEAKAEPRPKPGPKPTPEPRQRAAPAQTAKPSRKAKPEPGQAVKPVREKAATAKGRPASVEQPQRRKRP